jgi:hypothetical protein
MNHRYLETVRVYARAPGRTPSLHLKFSVDHDTDARENRYIVERIHSSTTISSLAIPFRRSSRIPVSMMLTW